MFKLFGGTVRRVQRFAVYSLRYICLWLLAVCNCAPAAFARDHFIAPREATPSAAPDGSFAAPWASIARALESGRVSGGDRLVLLRGHHGKIYIGKAAFEPSIMITGTDGGGAHVSGIRIDAGEGIDFDGLSVWPLSPPGRTEPLVVTGTRARDVTFTGMDIRGRGDAPETYMTWHKQDWLDTWRSSGVTLAGPGNRITQSRITGVAFALTLSGPDTVAVNNKISGFSGDGIRILGDRSKAIGNRIENCFKVDGNHDDGIQSWAPKDQQRASRSVTGLVLDGNTVIEWTGGPDHPLRCRLQGIGFFDGFFEDTVIQNNLVVVDHYHGISLYGARRSRVVNNTVVHISEVRRKTPWILLEDHKSGAPSQGNLFANNIAMGHINRSADSAAMPQHSNAVVQFPVRMFVNPTAFDFRPRADSGYLGAADPRYAPSRDITGAARPVGGGADLGAFQK